MFLDSLASDQTETHVILGTEMQKLKHITVCHRECIWSTDEQLGGGTASVLLESGTLPSPRLDSCGFTQAILSQSYGTGPIGTTAPTHVLLPSPAGCRELLQHVRSGPTA